MDIRFYNAKILTLTDGFQIQKGQLWVEGNRISYIGDGKDKETAQRAKEWDREIDVSGNLLMPGFKNAHTHSGMTFLRSYADDLPLLDWLHKQIFPMEERINEEDIYYFCKLAILEYLSSGITACFDMYLSPDAMAKASIDCGFRTVMVSGLNDFTHSLEGLEACFEKYNHNNELIHYCLGFHGEYTTSISLLKGVAALSQKYKAPVFTHNSETKAEVLECIQRHNATPTVFLDSLGMFEYGGGGYHCVHMTEADLNIFQTKKLTVVTNPGSNVKLASGTAPIKKMMDMGINIAIGTDGPASNNCLDMFREMFLTTGLAKLKENDASVVDANAVLSMATLGGARAMGLSDCDSLAVGKRADLIMIDLSCPNMQPIHNITKNLVYSGSKQNVKLTMVNGKILYEDGSYFIDQSPEELYGKIESIVNRIKS